jgi:hypothetical protein
MTLEALIDEAHRAGLKLHRLSELWSDTHPWVCELAHRDAQGGLVCPGERRGWGATPEAAVRAALDNWKAQTVDEDIFG